MNIRRLWRRSLDRLSRRRKALGPGQECFVSIDAGDHDETTLKTAHMLRGTIITQFSHAEFLLADLYFRAKRLEAYKELPLKLPYRVAQRIATAKKLATMPGPIGNYENRILGLVDELTRFETLRQFMAHGNMLVRFDLPKPRIYFYVYDQPKASPPIMKLMITTIDDLTNKSNDVTIYSEKIVKLCYDICTEIPLPQAADPI